MTRPAPAAIVLASLLILGCSRRPAPAGPWRSAVLITVDTLRADHLGAYGYERPTSPNLDALAARSTRFERALVPIGRTTQSLASILTGKDPIEHGVRGLHEPLAGEHVTLPERFRDAGYRTAAFIVVPFLWPMGPRGLDQGFDDFVYFEKTRNADLRAEVVVQAAERWLAEHEDEPFFLWLHFRDPHAPYWNHAGGLADRVTPAYAGRYRDYFHYWPVDDEGRRTGPQTKSHEEAVQAGKGRHKFGIDRYSELDVERVIALYDGEIEHTDRQIARVLDALAARGRGDDTVVVVTADHGESLGEHDFWFDHGEFVYDATLRVPLLVHCPTWPAAVVREQVGAIDVAPTLAELFGLDLHGGNRARSFAAALAGGTIQGRMVYAESGEPLMAEYNPRFAGGPKPRDPLDRQRAFVLPEPAKLIHDPRAPNGREFEYYRIADDPGELRNLADDPDLRARLERPKELLRGIRSRDDGQLGPKDPETLKALAEAGYVDGGG